MFKYFSPNNSLLNFYLKLLKEIKLSAFLKLTSYLLYFLISTLLLQEKWKHDFHIFIKL